MRSTDRKNDGMSPVAMIAEFARHAFPVAFTIAEFCDAHHISESYYYELRAAGLGPREIQLGTRRIISAEDAAAWRAERALAPVPPKEKKE
jgi:hypothetical protein